MILPTSAFEHLSVQFKTVANGMTTIVITIAVLVALWDRSSIPFRKRIMCVEQTSFKISGAGHATDTILFDMNRIQGIQCLGFAEIFSSVYLHFSKR